MDQAYTNNFGGCHSRLLSRNTRLYRELILNDNVATDHKEYIFEGFIINEITECPERRLNAAGNSWGIFFGLQIMTPGSEGLC